MSLIFMLDILPDSPCFLWPGSPFQGLDKSGSRMVQALEIYAGPRRWL